MSEPESTQYFVSESIKLARQMNLPDARHYLRGMLNLIGDVEEAHDIRDAAILLDQSDRQLELISITNSHRGSRPER